MIPAFLKRASWIKWKKYFDMWANAQDKAKLKQMTDENQIARAYYFLQQKFASSLESLAFYAQGAIVVKILLNLPVPDIKQVSSVSPTLRFIVDNFRLKQRRKNMGLFMAFSKLVAMESRIIMSCFSWEVFICVDDTNTVRFGLIENNIRIRNLYSRFHETPISKVFCGFSEAAFSDETNMLHILTPSFIPLSLNINIITVTFKFADAVTHVTFDPAKKRCYVTTNSAIYEANYRDLENIKLKSITSASNLGLGFKRKLLHVAFTKYALFSVFDEQKFLDGKVWHPITMDLLSKEDNYLSSVDGLIVDFWTDVGTFFIKTTESVYYWVGTKNSWLRNLLELLPKSFKSPL